VSTRKRCPSGRRAKMAKKIYDDRSKRAPSVPVRRTDARYGDAPYPDRPLTLAEVDAHIDRLLKRNKRAFDVLSQL
jgi:hypothetical protein